MAKNLMLVKSVEITAHRGSSAAAPENTMAAFRKAIDDGCDYIELDVQTCADGTVVVVHDRDFMRVAGDARRVEDLTFPEIRELDVGRWFSRAFIGERVPTLAEAIELVRDRVRLNIELKYNRPDPRLVPSVLDLLRRARFLDPCVITSVNAAALRDMKAAEPRLRTGLIVSADIGRVTQIDADVLSMVASQATPAAIREAHRAGKQVHVWTVNKPEAMLRLIATGADNLITDKPDVLRTVLRERATRPGPEKVSVRPRTRFAGGAPLRSAGPSEQQGHEPH